MEEKEGARERSAKVSTLGGGGAASGGRSRQRRTILARCLASLSFLPSSQVPGRWFTHWKRFSFIALNSSILGG